MPNKMQKIVPDTSVIIEGLVSQKIENKEIKPDKILIHEAVISELEHQANQNRETGFLGLQEIKKIGSISKKYKFEVEFTGKRPAEFEIRHAKSGEIDSLIRSLAQQENATLLTADKVQALVAEAKGIDVIKVEFDVEVRKIRLEDFFDANTMSVHLREKTYPHAKKGQPGKWEFVPINTTELTREDMREISKEIIEEAGKREDGFIEIQRPGSTIVQLGLFRIVIVKPPFSDGWEITAVRPVKKLSLNDYKLSSKLKERIAEQAEGILIAGAPGMGKSTFAQALAEHYASKNKVVKTVEAPRDLQLPDNITQYAISHGSPQEIHDILLLSRPDYTIFDEMRNTEDFRLYSDMRLAGVGMIGIVHGTNPIDAIQRFIGRIELGVIPQIIDTVLFIDKGNISKVFSVKIDVKVPSGMTEADLARPVVTVTDFETGRLEFEIYSYGEETIVVPVKRDVSSSAQALASKEIEREFSKYCDSCKVDVISDNKCRVYVPEHAISKIIGKKGENIERIEKKLGFSIDVEELATERADSGKKKATAEYDVKIDKKNISFFVDEKHSNRDVDIIVGGDFLMTAKVGKKGVVKIKTKHKLGKILVNAVNYEEGVELLI